MDGSDFREFEAKLTHWLAGLRGLADDVDGNCASR